MSKKFHAEHRVTGERWKSRKTYHEYLVMYDTGYLAVVGQDFYTYINPLDPKEWKVVLHDNIKTKKES